MIKSELLTELTAEQAIRKIATGLYGGEEKHNGERRTIVKENGVIRDYNREGNVGKGIKHQYLINALLAHPLDSFMIDVEYEQGQLVILDVLFLGGLDFRQQEYAQRKAAAHLAFDGRNKMVRVATTVTGGEAILALIKRVKSEHGEGVVLKRLDAKWKPGRSDQHFKLKFWKTLSAIVLGPSAEGHESVDVGLFDKKGALARIGGCSLIGKPRVVSGDIVEVKYLYASGEGHIVQPTILFQRDDVHPQECTTAQLVVNKNWQNLGQ